MVTSSCQVGKILFWNLEIILGKITMMEPACRHLNDLRFNSKSLLYCFCFKGATIKITILKFNFQVKLNNLTVIPQTNFTIGIFVTVFYIFKNCCYSGNLWKAISAGE